MLKILETAELTEKLKQVRTDYENLKREKVFFETFPAILAGVEDWKYSTGPIFDSPPFSAEMAGFDPGKLLKKTYPGPYEARLKGSYSSGFVKGEHVVTILPGKPAEMPLEAVFFQKKEDVTFKYSVKIYDVPACRSKTTPLLFGLSWLFNIEDRYVQIGVGERNSYVIRVYYSDNGGRIIRASAVTGPFDFQDDFEFVYDEAENLKAVLSDGLVWEKKDR